MFVNIYFYIVCPEIGFRLCLPDAPNAAEHRQLLMQLEAPRLVAEAMKKNLPATGRELLYNVLGCFLSTFCAQVLLQAFEGGGLVKLFRARSSSMKRLIRSPSDLATL